MELTNFKKLCLRLAVVVTAAVALPAIIMTNNTNINKPIEYKADKPIYTQISQEQQKNLQANNIANTIIDERKVAPELFAFINNDDDSITVAKKLSDSGNDFMALATVVENLENKPYYDTGGLNVGMGYCITKRLAEHGKEQIQKELLQAGFDQENIDTLLDGKKKDILKVEVTNKQAVILLSETSKQYEQIAKDNIGEDLFNKLPKKEQAVWTYFAWNTGENMGQFKNLIKGIQDGDSKKVLNNVTPSFRNSDGEMQQNKRLGIAIQTSLIDGIDAIANGEQYDHTYHEKNISSKINSKYLKHHNVITKVNLDEPTRIASNDAPPPITTENSISKLQQLRNKTTINNTTAHSM